MNYCINKPICVYLVIVGYTLVYLMLPTSNSDIDAYNYAANVKWVHDLFFPHHLLYNFFHHAINATIYPADGPHNTLAAMKRVNALFAGLTLLAVHALTKKTTILSNHSAGNFSSLSVVVFVGSSFGFMRYATENETYIIPLFWSVLASYWYVQYISGNRKVYLLVSGIFCTMACLFHQLHALWYAGLFFATLTRKKYHGDIWLFILPSLLLPISYYLAFKLGQHDFSRARNVFEFALYEYFYGAANTSFGISNLVFGIISFVRSFIQVHGIIAILTSNYPVLYILPIAQVILALVVFRKFFKLMLQLKAPNFHSKAFLIVFALHFAFAIFSDGNKEFMVMLPLLGVFILIWSLNLPVKLVFITGFSMLVWNLSFGLLPNHLIDWYNHKSTLEFVKSDSNAVFILSDAVLIQNMIYYQSGERWQKNIFKSPASAEKDTKQINQAIEKAFHAKRPVFTDCINEPNVLNRKYFIQKSKNNAYFANFKAIEAFKMPSYTGIRHFYQLIP
jgi:hypothetical protein